MATIRQLQGFSQFIGGNFRQGAFIDAFDRRQKIADIAAVQSGDVKDFGIIDKMQFALKLQFDRFARFLV